jgi:hypothetical protein
MARVAVVSGTATAVSGRVSRRQAQRWGAQDEAQYQEPQQAYAEPPPPPAGDPRIEQLQQLGQLKEQGVLTDDEFAAEKARILG